MAPPVAKKVSEWTLVLEECREGGCRYYILLDEGWEWAVSTVSCWNGCREVLDGAATDGGGTEMGCGIPEGGAASRCHWKEQEEAGWAAEWKLEDGSRGGDAGRS